jgi:hypothetical protein
MVYNVEQISMLLRKFSDVNCFESRKSSFPILNCMGHYMNPMRC